MPVRVGNDLALAESVKDSVDRHGRRYLDRIYTERELADCAGSGRLDHERLAARWAAKEATIKVLRPSSEDAVPWRDIELDRRPGGWTALRLGGRAAELAATAGISDLAVSVAHEAGLASAVVVAEVTA
jgi:holo-[acyl-carrier protein] synthase